MTKKDIQLVGTKCIVTASNLIPPLCGKYGMGHGQLKIMQNLFNHVETIWGVLPNLYGKIIGKRVTSLGVPENSMEKTIGLDPWTGQGLLLG